MAQEVVQIKNLTKVGNSLSYYDQIHSTRHRHHHPMGWQYLYIYLSSTSLSLPLAE